MKDRRKERRKTSQYDPKGMGIACATETKTKELGDKNNLKGEKKSQGTEERMEEPLGRRNR